MTGCDYILFIFYYWQGYDKSTSIGNNLPFRAWCPLKGQLYLSKPAGQVYFRQETDIWPSLIKIYFKS